MNDRNFQSPPMMIWRMNALAFAGALPFVGAFLLLIHPFQGFDGAFIAVTYAALIIAFLCGTHWMQALKVTGADLSFLLWTSNLVTVIAWGALLFLRPSEALGVHEICFVFLFLLDRKLFRSIHMPHWYYVLRRNVTFIVVVLIACMIALIV
jgi:Protein of unknown function (DUF3429)